MKKKKLLIAYGNAYLFDGSMVPVVPKLGNMFNVFVILSNGYIPAQVIEQLKQWVITGTIKGYLIVPEYKNNMTAQRNILKLHFFMKSNIQFLRDQQFDLFVSISGMQVFERYLMECILPRDCVRVCLWTSGHWLLVHESFVSGLLRGEKAINLTANLRLGFFPKQEATIGKSNLIHKFVTEIKTPNSFFKVVKKTLRFVISKVRASFIYRGFYSIQSVFDRFILPKLLVGKTFSLRKYDEITQISTDEFDVFIVLNKINTIFFESFYENASVCLAQHPVAGSCCCHPVQMEKSAVLVCLTSVSVTGQSLNLFCRDLQIVMKESGAKIVHIRLHPRTQALWYEELLNYLQERGIVAAIAGNEKPIRENVCNYMGVVGYASNALQEARASCDYAFVVGFVAVSEMYCQNPKFLLGDVAGLETTIDWIEADGSYDPGIFKRKYHPASNYRTIPEILMALDVADKRTTAPS